MRWTSAVPLAFALTMLLCAASVVLAVDAPNHADDAAAAKVVDQLYGRQIKAARATADSADDLALAAKLLAAARTSVSSPALMRQLCEQACDLSARYPAGFDTADTALQLLIDHRPAADADDHAAASTAVADDEQLATLRRRHYIQTRGDAKRAAGELYIDAMMHLASDRLAADVSAADAAGDDLRQALAVASAIHSPRINEIHDRFDQLNTLRLQQRRISNLRDQLKKDPKNKDAAEQLMKLYVVELDDPAEAAKLTFLLPASDWAKHLPLAILAPAKLTLDEATSVGNWYRNLADQATGPDARAAMLRRAAVDYQHALTMHPPDALHTQQLNLLLSDVQNQLARLGVKPVAPPTPIPSPSNPTAPGPSDLAAGQSLDLLPLIDLNQDKIAGAWAIKDGVLRGGNGEASRIQIPLTVQGDYRIDADVARFGRFEMLSLALPVGDHQVLFMVDSHPDQGGETGLCKVNNLDINDPHNPTVHHGKLTDDSHNLHHLSATVHLDGDNATVDGSFDNNSVLHWTGPAAALYVPDNLTLPNPHALGLAVWDTTYEIHNLKLTLLHGTVHELHYTAANPTTALADARAGKELIDSIQFPDAIIRGKWEKQNGVITGGAAEQARIMLPVGPTGDYRLRVDFRRTEGNDALIFVAPFASRQLRYAFDSVPAHGSSSGLEFHMAHADDASNPTRVAGPQIENNHWYTFTLEVHTSRDAGHIQVTLDDKTMCDWTGNQDRMIPEMRYFRLPIRDAIEIGTWQGNLQIRSIKLQTLSGGVEPVAFTSKLADLKPVGSPTYLSDLPEQKVHVMVWKGAPLFGKGSGPQGIGDIRIAGVHSPHGLLIHAAHNDPAFVDYALDGRYHLFVGAVGNNDSAGRAASEMWFSIYGDGKLLWRSRPRQGSGTVQPFNVDVTGVRTLRIKSSVSDTEDHAHAVWIEPALYLAARRADGLVLGTAKNPPNSNTPPTGSTATNTSTDSASNNGTFFGIPTK